MTEADDLIAAHHQVEDKRKKRPSVLKEQLAEQQHEIWSHWMRYLADQCTLGPEGQFVIPADKAGRWVRQMWTSYNRLSEREKKSDRDQAQKIMTLLIRERWIGFIK